MKVHMRSRFFFLGRRKSLGLEDSQRSGDGWLKQNICISHTLSPHNGSWPPLNAGSSIWTLQPVENQREYSQDPTLTQWENFSWFHRGPSSQFIPVDDSLLRSLVSLSVRLAQTRFTRAYAWFYAQILLITHNSLHSTTQHCNQKDSLRGQKGMV